MNKVWAYTISKPLQKAELLKLQELGNTFVANWTAHENKLASSFNILNNRIILVKVDEQVASATGCSIDKLMRFVKDTELNFGVELLNRFLVAYKNGNDIEVTHATKIKELLSQCAISENTIILNTAIANDAELTAWEQPLKNTWLAKYL
jgi:hypothetical protein